MSSAFLTSQIIKSGRSSGLIRDGSSVTRIIRFLRQLSMGHQLADGSNMVSGDFSPPPRTSTYSSYNAQPSTQLLIKPLVEGSGASSSSSLPPTFFDSPNAKYSKNGNRAEVAVSELQFIQQSYSKPVVNFWSDNSSTDTKNVPWQPLFLDYGVTGIPKTNNNAAIPFEDKFNLSRGFGEDSCFIRRDSLGVADGVGGWKKHKGASSAFFSRNLMHFACQEISKLDYLYNLSMKSDDQSIVYPSSSEIRTLYDQIDPVKVLETSYRLATESASIHRIKGSSTACIVILRNDELRVANLGDCGVVVLRQGKIIFQSLEQQHAFNFPYQLGTNSSDKPTDAQYYSVPVMCGDVIVMGSDGLFDNLFSEDIEEEVAKWTPALGIKPQTFDRIAGELLGLTASITTFNTNDSTCSLRLKPGDLSHALAARACYVSRQTKVKATPFNLRADSAGLKHEGGKRDDITVLVAVVAPRNHKYVN